MTRPPTYPNALHRLLSNSRRFATALAVSAPLLAAPTSRASPLSDFVPYAGQGNLAVFDAATGTGGWTGELQQLQPPAVADPLSALTVVLFQLDAASHTLSGTIQLTTTDLLSTLEGTVSGSYVDDDILAGGGQFMLDYNLGAGTGLFAHTSGHGLAFVDYSPGSSPNNYSESGLLTFTVPEPGSLMLAALAALVAWQRQQVLRRRPGGRPVPPAADSSAG